MAAIGSEASARLVRAFSEYFVGGIKTNLSLFRRILGDPDFQAGKLDTGYLDRLLQSRPAAPEPARHGGGRHCRRSVCAARPAP